MADEINTGGGPSVGRNVDSGRDFVGRDTNINYYNVDEMDTEQLVKVIARRFIGSDLYGVKGVVSEIREINDKVSGISVDQGQGRTERKQLREEIEKLAWRINSVAIAGTIIVSIQGIAIIFLLLRAWGT